MELPEEIHQIGSDAMSAIWQVAHRIVQEDIEKIKEIYHHKETELLTKHQTALDSIDYLKKSIAELKQSLDLKGREYKSLKVDFERRTGELSNEQTHTERLEEKILSQEHDVKRLTEELARTKENLDYQNRRLDEIVRQTKLDEQNAQKLKEDLATNIKQKERLQEQYQHLLDEHDAIQHTFKSIQAQATSATAALEENRIALKKSEQTVQEVKGELNTTRDILETEQKGRFELEKKYALLQTQVETQEFSHREAMKKIEQELSLYKSEAQTLRTRMIKTEGALEREKKAVERLETRLAVLASGKSV